MRAPSRKTGAHHALLAGFLGWTLDAFDFFVIVFLYDTLAHEFNVPKKAIVLTTTATLALRPVGALFFGLLSDRFGRRIPLMANVIYFSIVELACGFATNYNIFLILRALFGIGMGGEWGVGASLAMEAAPPRWRGMLSGILQSGYSTGYILAAIAAREALRLSGGADDVYDVSVARNTRLVSRLSERGSSREAHARGGHRDYVQHGSGGRRDCFWSAVAGDWTA